MPRLYKDSMIDLLNYRLQYYSEVKWFYESQKASVIHQV